MKLWVTHLERQTTQNDETGCSDGNPDAEYETRDRGGEHLVSIHFPKQC